VKAPAAGGRASRYACRVLVVDDHDVVHWGFRMLLAEAAPGVERCLAARTAEEALTMTRTLKAGHVRASVDLFLGS